MIRGVGVVALMVVAALAGFIAGVRFMLDLRLDEYLRLRFRHEDRDWTDVEVQR